MTKANLTRCRDRRLPALCAAALVAALALVSVLSAAHAHQPLESPQDGSSVVDAKSFRGLSTDCVGCRLAHHKGPVLTAPSEVRAAVEITGNLAPVSDAFSGLGQPQPRCSRAPPVPRSA